MDKETFQSRILNSQGQASLLCQPHGQRGCGGCCGDFGRPRQLLEILFRARKVTYDSEVRGEDDLLPFRKKMDLREKGFRQCRFLGFLDDKSQTVGCLLHPGRKENRGMDFRNYGFYEDSNFCASNFCSPSKKLLSSDSLDKQFFLLLQEGLDWYHYSRLFSFYVDLGGIKGLLNIYVRFTRPLYAMILTRCRWTELQGKSFGKHYNTMLEKIVNKIKPSSTRAGKDDPPFPHILEILSDKDQADAIDIEVDRFLNALNA